MKTETKALIIDSVIFGSITLTMIICTAIALCVNGLEPQSFVCLAMSVVAIIVTSIILYVRITNYLEAYKTP
jgi:hypothetical protein